MTDHTTPGDATARAPSPVLAHASACGRLCRAALFLTVGVVAGAVAFYGIGNYRNTFQLPTEILWLMEQDHLSEAEGAAISEAVTKNRYQNTVLSVAIFGGVAGCLLGLAAGVGRRTVTASATGLVAGAILGTLFGGLAGAVELYTANAIWRVGPDTVYVAMVFHSVAFLIAGVGIGIAAGLAARRVTASVGVVLAAALVAGLIYPGIAAALFPISNTDAVVPPHEVFDMRRVFGLVDFVPLALWTLLPTALMGLALGRIKALPAAPRV